MLVQCDDTSELGAEAAEPPGKDSEALDHGLCDNCRELYGIGSHCNGACFDSGDDDDDEELSQCNYGALLPDGLHSDSDSAEERAQPCQQDERQRGSLLAC